MFNEKMYGLGSRRSVIRELFEFGKRRMIEVGADKVYDFSLGNPNVPAPECVRQALLELASVPDTTAVHGYTSAQGDAEVRKTIADSINRRFGAGIDADLIYMTAGAAASLTITLNALCEEGDEFILFAPYFPEYKVFVSAAGGKPMTVDFDDDFQIDFDSLRRALSPKTKAVVVNSPNNPSGAVYTRETVQKLAAALRDKSAELGRPIFLISDEPYREIVYDGAEVPYLMNCYDDTIVCYSYSKSLSLPGERIGYVAISPKACRCRELYSAVCGAGRALGYVCAPSTYQRVIMKCVDALPDVTAYRRNRDLLYGELTRYGYECVRPDGAFYLFVRALEPDANSFADRAKQLGLLLVPGDDFGAPGYIRASYCVNYDMIKRSLPAFRQLKESYE